MWSRSSFIYGVLTKAPCTKAPRTEAPWIKTPKTKPPRDKETKAPKAKFLILANINKDLNVLNCRV